jgi:Protein of unknown function (DUF3551)
LRPCPALPPRSAGSLLVRPAACRLAATSYLLSGSGLVVEDIMRNLATAAILLATLVLGTESASAAPWCTEYGGARGGGSNCGFYSFEQCMANAWGNGGFCRRNAFEDPYWRGQSVRRYRR